MLHRAEVRVVRLPAEPDGTKNGLDDFLVRRGADQLRQFLDATRPVPKSEAALADPTAFADSGYIALRGHTFYCVLARDENDDLVVAKKTKLANFSGSRGTSRDGRGGDGGRRGAAAPTGG